jgi:hypothetical protein
VLSEAVAGLEIDDGKSQEKATPAINYHFHPGRVHGRAIASAYSSSFEKLIHTRSTSSAANGMFQS